MHPPCLHTEPALAHPGVWGVPVTASTLPPYRIHNGPFRPTLESNQPGDRYRRATTPPWTFYVPALDSVLFSLSSTKPKRAVHPLELTIQAVPLRAIYQILAVECSSLLRSAELYAELCIGVCVCVQLGYMALTGYGMEKDLAKAFKYFTAAAEQVRGLPLSHNHHLFRVSVLVRVHA